MSDDELRPSPEDTDWLGMQAQRDVGPVLSGVLTITFFAVAILMIVLVRRYG